MATTYKVLGQLNPTANNLTPVYIVPAGTQTVVSSITICNQGATATTFKLAVQPANATIDPKHYMNFNTALNGSDTMILQLGLTLNQTDVISVIPNNANISIHVYGSELT
jgi:hypothetical protein